MLEMMATRHRLGLRALTAALLLAGCGGQASGATGASDRLASGMPMSSDASGPRGGGLGASCAAAAGGDGGGVSITS